MASPRDPRDPRDLGPSGTDDRRGPGHSGHPSDPRDHASTPWPFDPAPPPHLTGDDDAAAEMESHLELLEKGLQASMPSNELKGGLH